MIVEKLKNIALNLPDKPGVYQFFDANANLIYVGKAKNLKTRVLSYFNKTLDRPKTVILVRQICDIKYITVKSETDAFLLENTLIKKHRPKYNIQLKDDKSYPWIVIKNEPFPRVLKTRTLSKDGSEYFGPYTSVVLVRTMIIMFKKIYNIRTCKLNLSQEHIKQGRFKECLQYHIKNCRGPCIAKQSEIEYLKNIDSIREILKGKISKVISYIKLQMHSEAESLNFEKAMELQRSLSLLENFQSKSTVVNSQAINIDIFSISSTPKFAYVNFLKLIEGKIVQAYSTQIKKALDESDVEVLEKAIIDIETNILRGITNVREIIVPFEISISYKNIVFKVPQKGLKHELLKLSERNLKYYRLEKERQMNQIDPNRRTNELLERMKKDLNLANLPVHIECFDNSNLQGTNPVAACVVFKNGKPSKKDYRKFNIKTVVGADDFASMKEVVYRRYKRVIDEKAELPQLIIIDGGKGQLSHALESLTMLEINNKVAIISIAKRLEEIFFPDDPYPLYLDKSSPTLKIIQQLRDEAHRFGITFHRQKRGKAMLKSELTNIKGIGEKSAIELLKHFGSLKTIKEISVDELSKVIGSSRAKIIFDYYNKSFTVDK